MTTRAERTGPCRFRILAHEQSQGACGTIRLDGEFIHQIRRSHAPVRKRAGMGVDDHQRWLVFPGKRLSCDRIYSLLDGIFTGHGHGHAGTAVGRRRSSCWAVPLAVQPAGRVIRRPAAAGTGRQRRKHGRRQKPEGFSRQHVFLLLFVDALVDDWPNMASSCVTWITSSEVVPSTYFIRRQESSHSCMIFQKCRKWLAFVIFTKMTKSCKKLNDLCV